VRRSLLLFFTPFIICTWFFFGISSDGCHSVMQADAAKKIPFMHKTHIEKYGAQDCEQCHGYDENGRFKGTPSVAECTVCHARDAQLVTNGYDTSTPRRKPMFDAYKDTDRPWGSYAKQPDLVYFSHKVVMTAKYEDGRLKARCASCHGDKAKTIDTKMVKGKMLMGQCMDCHTALHLSNSCAVCHD
jgi:menaquinone reductase, multiheme cytochrome c subunit